MSTPDEISQLQSRRRTLQRQVLATRSILRVAQAHFDVAVAHLMLPGHEALATLPTTRSGQAPPANDLLAALQPGGRAGLHTLATVLQDIQRYTQDLDSELNDLTESLVSSLQENPSACLPIQS